MNRTAQGTADGVEVAPPTLGDRAAAALASYREGHSGLLAAFVREATPLLWSIVRSQGVERDDAEDVVQGVWLAFARNADAIREPEALLKWLVVSARRAAWQAAARTREHARRTTVIADPELTPARGLRAAEPPPDDAVLTVERDRVLWRTFRRLPERCQQILRCVALADRPDYALIAEITGLPVTSVGVNRGRCLAKLRTLLDHDEVWVVEG